MRISRPQSLDSFGGTDTYTISWDIIIISVETSLLLFFINYLFFIFF